MKTSPSTAPASGRILFPPIRQLQLIKLCLTSCQCAKAWKDSVEESRNRKPSAATGMASAAFSRPPLAYRVSAAARDNPLVRDLYDDDEIEDVTPQPQVCCSLPLASYDFFCFTTSLSLLRLS